MLDSSTSPKDLAKLLGTTYGQIKRLYYDQSKNLSYKSFQINKKTGGVRNIEAPEKRLLLILQRLKEILTPLYLPRSSVHGFQSGRSIVSNAEVHIRKRYVFNIDLDDFFGSITFARVRGMLISKPYELNKDTASVIAHLSTLNGVLPQGSPVSPILSNMICRGMDKELQSLAKKSKSVYTRYGDDITFSFRGSVEYIAKEVVFPFSGGVGYYEETPGSTLVDIIHRNGFRINHTKTRLQGYHQKQVVTGLVVNRKTNVDRRFVRKTRALIHRIEADGVDYAESVYKLKANDDSASLVYHVYGRMLFIKQVKGEKSSVYHNLAVRFNSLSVDLHLPVIGEPYEALPYKVEGHAFEKKCWVIISYSVGIQGTAFMTEYGYLVTCAHVVDWGQNVSSYDVYRIGDTKNSFSVEVVAICNHRDVAILRLVTENESINNFEFFRLSKYAQASQLAEVSILGFPEFKVGTKGVGRIWARVSNAYSKSAVNYFEVDKGIASGNSGGPVINRNNQLVGIAVKGVDDFSETNAFLDIRDVINVFKANHLL